MLGLPPSIRDGFTVRPSRLSSVEPKREIGGREQRVAPILRIASGVGRAAAHDDPEIAAAWPRAGQRSVGQRRGLVGQRRALALRRMREQGRRAERADFLVAVDHDLIADAIGARASLDGLERGKHDGEPALHVGDAGSVQHPVLEPARLLEGVIGAEHRVHVAGEEQLDRRRRPHRQMEVASMLQLRCLAGAIDGLDRLRLFQPKHARERRKRVGEQVRHSLQPGKVARSAVDRRPAEHLVEHRLGARALDRVLFAGRQSPIPARS